MKPIQAVFGSAVLTIFAILLKYPTSEYKIRVSAHCIVRTNIDIKVTKRPILSLKCSFLGQKRKNVHVYCTLSRKLLNKKVSKYYVHEQNVLFWRK